MGDIGLQFSATDFDEFGKELSKKLGTGNDSNNVFNKHMLTIMKKSQKYVLNNLKAKTPKGPTGNLKKSALTVARSYKKNRKWFTATGFSTQGKKNNPPKQAGKRRTGSFLGYHAGLVEFGTNNRKNKRQHCLKLQLTGFHNQNNKQRKKQRQAKNKPRNAKRIFQES